MSRREDTWRDIERTTENHREGKGLGGSIKSKKRKGRV